MRDSPRAILSLAFAISLAAFLIGPALLPATFGPYPLLRWGDILDLGTAPVVLAMAWLLFRRGLAPVLSLVWAGLNDWQLVEFSKAGLIE